MLTCIEHKELFIETADGSRVGIVLDVKTTSAERERLHEAYKLLLDRMEDIDDIYTADMAVAENAKIA